MQEQEWELISLHLHYCCQVDSSLDILGLSSHKVQSSSMLNTGRNREQTKLEKNKENFLVNSLEWTELFLLRINGFCLQALDHGNFLVIKAHSAWIA